MPNRKCPDGQTIAGPTGRCLHQPNGSCGWEVKQCPAGTPAVTCVRTGCSGTVCAAAGKEVMTTCEYSPSYACYDQAKCEKQPNGNCGWTPTPALDSCLKAGGPAVTK